MGNRLYYGVQRNGKVIESAEYTYNRSNQIATEKSFDGHDYATLKYSYDKDGNLIGKTGKDGREKVNLRYDYTVENRLRAVHDGKTVLMAAAYDGDGNRIFQLNYNGYVHEKPDWDDDWDDDHRPGRPGWDDDHRPGRPDWDDDWDDDDHRPGRPDWDDDWDDDDDYRPGRPDWDDDWDDDDHRPERPDWDNDGHRRPGRSLSAGLDTATSSNASETEPGKPEQEEQELDIAIGETNMGILIPESRMSETEKSFLSCIPDKGMRKDYELIEYVNDVNRQYTEVLMETNIDGRVSKAYTYGNERISIENSMGWKGYYLYDPRGSVSSVTNRFAAVSIAYRYTPTGEMTLGKPLYANVYGYNGESYNPNTGLQYLRARYFQVEQGNFLTEDTYLGNLAEPLTLNRYNYVMSNPLNYIDPSGHDFQSPEDMPMRGEGGWPKPGKEFWDRITDDSRKGYDYRGTPEYWNERALDGSNLDEIVEEIQEVVWNIIEDCGSYRDGAHARIQLRMENFTSLEYWLNPDEHEIPQSMKDYIKDLYENAGNQDRFRDGYIDGEVYAVFMFAGEMASIVGVGLHKISTEGNKIFRGTAQVQLAGGGTIEIPIEVESGDASVAVGIIPGEGFDWDSYLQSKTQGEGGSKQEGDSETKEVNVPKNVERKAKKLSPEAKKGYEKAIDALKSGDTRGLNDHPLSGNRSGQRAIDIKGTGKGRGAGRIIYEYGKNGEINIIEILTDHNY